MINELLNSLKTELERISVSLGANDPQVMFEVPKDSSFGDYSSNIAMRLAKELRKAPIMIANEIKEKLDLAKFHLSRVDAVNPGFINFFIDRVYLTSVVNQINALGDDYGNLNIGEGKKINIEFVSANPTGYLHVGHGRGAAYGDSLARILTKAGYNITKEHYVNDGGNQINNLALSIYERYKELFGLECNLGDDYYHGVEIITVAKEIKDLNGNKFLHEEWYDYFRAYGVNYLLNGLKADLKRFNVEFDVWFSEKSLYDTGKVQATIDALIEGGHTYMQDGALWLKTTDEGDEKDRVLIKSDKTLTYLTPDIAYHSNKLSRGYDMIIDVFGADHHGYIERLKAAIKYMGFDKEKLVVEILQMVRVLQNGEEVKMSKRSGKAITLRDMIDDAGTDALRYMYSSKALSTHMDLDLDLMVKQSNENPVYYVQYAYARICSLFRKLEENGCKFSEKCEFSHIDLTKTEKIVLDLIQYPMVISEAAINRYPHKITAYVYNLASDIHSFYNDNKIIVEDLDRTCEILTILKAASIVLKNALSLIGVGIKEKM